jgi:hypothetical protein
MSNIQTTKQNERWSKSAEIRRDTFISKANDIHKNMYDYSNVLYKNAHTKVNIICQQHGPFEQRPYGHIHLAQGCPKCVHNYPYTIDDIRKKSKLKYGEQYTILSPFTGNKHPLALICNIPHHGKFVLPTAEVHLRQSGGGGCPLCAKAIKLENLKPGNISKVEKEWLDSMAVPLRQHTVIIDQCTYIVDGFDPSTNTVYECYGSFWHGNPDQYMPNQMNTVVMKTFGELYQNTVIRESALLTRFNVISKWV